MTTLLPRRASFSTGRKYLEVYLQREGNSQNRYQITTVLRHLGHAILSNPDRYPKEMVSGLRVAAAKDSHDDGRAYPPILSANARLLGEVSLLQEYLIKGNFSKRVIASYPSLLRRFLKFSGHINVVRPPIHESRLREFRPDWQHLDDLVSRSVSLLPLRSHFRRLAEWATDRDLPPDPIRILEESNDFYLWIQGQSKRFRYPNYTYTHAKCHLRKFTGIHGFPALSLASRRAMSVGISFKSWPSGIRGDWERLVEKWKDPNCKRGRHIGEMRPDTIRQNTYQIARFLGFLQHVPGMTSRKFEHLRLKDIIKAKFILAHGKAMKLRMTARDAKAFPELLPDEVGKPTGSVSGWYRLAATMMKYDFDVSPKDEQLICDAAMVAEAQRRTVREKDPYIIPAKELEKIPQEIHGRRVERELSLIDTCKTAGIIDNRHPSHMTPELSTRILRAGDPRLLGAWRCCGSLVSKELLFGTRRYRPLRSRNYIEMRWKVNLFCPQQEWLMRYDRSQMKTLRSGLKEWRQRFPEGLVPLLEYWRSCYHPWFWDRSEPRNEAYVFLTKYGRPYADANAFGVGFKSWTKFVLGKSIWAHLWRDIVVLELLQLHNRDFLVVADMIGDTPASVEKFYTRWQPLRSAELCDAVWAAQAAGADVASTRELVRKLNAQLRTTKEMNPQQKVRLTAAIREDLGNLKELLSALEWGTAVKSE